MLDKTEHKFYNNILPLLVLANQQELNSLLKYSFSLFLVLFKNKNESKILIFEMELFKKGDLNIKTNIRSHGLPL